MDGWIELWNLVSVLLRIIWYVFTNPNVRPLAITVCVLYVHKRNSDEETKTERQHNDWTRERSVHPHTVL